PFTHSNAASFHKRRGSPRVLPDLGSHYSRSRRSERRIDLESFIDPRFNSAEQRANAPDSLCDESLCDSRSGGFVGACAVHDDLVSCEDAAVQTLDRGGVYMERAGNDSLARARGRRADVQDYRRASFENERAQLGYGDAVHSQSPDEGPAPIPTV